MGQKNILYFIYMYTIHNRIVEISEWKWGHGEII